MDSFIASLNVSLDNAFHEMGIPGSPFHIPPAWVLIRFSIYALAAYGIFLVLLRVSRLRKAKPVMQPLNRGSQLKLDMMDGSKRVVRVDHLCRNGILVREDFHGIYILNIDEVRFLYTSDGAMHLPSYLMEQCRLYGRGIVQHA